MCIRDRDIFHKIAIQLEDKEKVLVSEIIDDIKAEARAYVIDGVCKDMAFYEGDADLNNGKKFMVDFISTHKDHLPKTLVVDLAFSTHKGWFVLEFNACWGSGLNNCRAEKVLDCIISATVN